MTYEQKKQVREALMRYTGSFDTQTAAAESLDGISPSTISMVKHHNWELLTDRLWQHIASQVGFYCGDWQPADTTAHLLLRILMGDAQRYAMAYGIAMSSGIGKTFTAMHYAHANENVFYIAGRADHNRKTFLDALLHICGYEGAATAAPNQFLQLVQHINAKDAPLLIIDDAHLLKDRVLHLIVLLAGSLAGQVGIVIMGDATLRTRIIDGVRLGRPGFEEIYKTIGRRFITLSGLAPADVPAVCTANGVHDEDTVKYICAESGGNLHTATCLIEEHRAQRIAA